MREKPSEAPSAPKKIEFEKRAKETAVTEEQAAAEKLEYRARLETRQVDRREILGRTKQLLSRRIGRPIDPSLERDFSVLAKKNITDIGQLRGRVHEHIATERSWAEKESYVILTGKELSPDAKVGEKVARIMNDPLLKNYEKTPDIGLKKIAALKQRHSLAGSPAEIRAAVLYARMSNVQYDMAARAFENEGFLRTFADRASSGDEEGAFEEALSRTEELAQLYEEYRQAQEDEQIQELIAEAVEAQEVTVLEPPSATQRAEALALATSASGIALNFGESSVASVEFGDLRRDVALFVVAGRPQFFVYDENADTTVRGPIEPAKLGEALRDVSVDTVFSETFQRYAPRVGEADPGSLPDATLHDLFTHLAGVPSSVQLSKKDAAWARFLAQLLATPDPDARFTNTKDKARELKRLLVDPARLDATRRWLEKNQWRFADNTKSEKPISLSELRKIINLSF